MAKGGWPKRPKVGIPGREPLYSLDVSIIGGPVTEEFLKVNPVISRTIQIRGEQTLEDLHYAIYRAFDRWDDHMYEFQFGKGPDNRKAKRYVLPGAMRRGLFGVFGRDRSIAGDLTRTTLAELDLKVGDSFGYSIWNGFSELGRSWLNPCFNRPRAERRHHAKDESRQSGH